MRALVIDDAKTIRVILAGILRDLGFEVEEAADGREALEKLKSCPGIGLALVDWNMPVMGGLEFVQAVRANPEFRALQLVMVTTEAGMSHVQSALEAGADEYVMKPFTPEALRDKLAILGIEQG